MSRFILFSFCLFAVALSAQNPQDAVVPVQLSAGLNPPSVFITWENPQPSDISLRRRVKGEAGNSWVTLVAANETLLNGYFDTGLDGSKTYEYAVERKQGNITAHGYAYANFFTPVTDQRGKLLVFIDSTTADLLGADLIVFKNDLRSEGWELVPFKTGPFTSVQWVKNQIVQAYNADPEGVKAVLLMGPVPVPYSGSNAWDGKADHAGAWPCDAYYGDVNGIWTDQTVNLPNTPRTANRNVPGDGKFDQNTLPSAVELPVGRLDFRRLSPATFGLSPIELLRRYLAKNHQWRSGLYKVPQKALVDDHLGWANGEAFAADGYRNAIPLVGEGNVETGDFIQNKRYLLSYGAASSGTYSSAGGIGSAAQFAADSVHTVFASVFGDYFGDWDFETDPLLPALLASKGGALAVNWAGRPRWMTQGLATGETIGHCLLETQNAQFNDAYSESVGKSGAHVALLGDPTLRALIVPPARELQLHSNCTKVNLQWQASVDPEVLGYLIYRSQSQDGPYVRLTPDLVHQTAWEDLSPPADTLFYSVRAVKLEITPGGGAFYNSSTGALKSVIFVPDNGPTVIGLGGLINCNFPSLTLGANFQPPNCTVQWYKPNGQAHSGFTATEGGVYRVVATAPNGCTAQAFATVYQDTTLPVVNFPSFASLDCAHPTLSYTVPSAAAGILYHFNGAEVFPGQVLNINAPSEFVVSSSDNGCSKTYLVQVSQDFVPPGAQIQHTGLVLDCNHSSIQLSGSSNVPNASFMWTGNGGVSTAQNVTVTAAGLYCLTTTGPNGCTSTQCVTVTANSAVLLLSVAYVGDPCGAEAKTLAAQVSGGAGPYQYTWSTGGNAQTETLPAGFSGVVGLSVTDANGCQGQLEFEVAEPLEMLALTKKESSAGAMDGYIDLLILNGTPPFAFQWSNGSTEEDLYNLSNGTYTVTVTQGDGCSAVLTISLGTVNAQEPLAAQGSSLRIAPNPTTGTAQLISTSPLPSELPWLLCDPNGKILATGTGTKLDLSHLPVGMYWLWAGGVGVGVVKR
jgi:hypothetical protein